MDINVNISNESLTINIENPHRFDLNQVTGRIRDFGRMSGCNLSDIDLEGLIHRMIRGVAGCEAGCPSDAKGLIREGFNGFNLSYIEGGILSAEARLRDGQTLTLKVFPEFN